MTMTMRREKIPTERISEMEDLHDLRKYACSKVQYLKDWWMKCVDCPSLLTCTTGKRAVKLAEMCTAPGIKGDEEKTEMPNPKTQLREYIIWIFSQKDPVKELLKNSTAVKPQSVYQRVNIWRKNYPDLEEKYHMLEKFRFLWSKPYDQMRVSDILRMKYPEENEPAAESKAGNDIPGLEKKQSEQSTDIPGTPAGDAGMSEAVSLSDFLAEMRIEGPVSITKPAVPARTTEPEYPAKTENIGNPETKKPENSQPVNLAEMVKKLQDHIDGWEADIKMLQIKIEEARKQMEAVRTVQLMIRSGV